MNEFIAEDKGNGEYSITLPKLTREQKDMWVEFFSQFTENLNKSWTSTGVCGQPGPAGVAGRDGLSEREVRNIVRDELNNNVSDYSKYGRFYDFIMNKASEWIPNKPQ